MVYRVYVEKKKGLENEAKALLSDVRSLLGISELEDIRLLNRYDTENIEEGLFNYAKTAVFSEPQLDIVYDELPLKDCVCFGVEYLPGQFDQRADSAAQCIQIISQGERPVVKTAKIYGLYHYPLQEERDILNCSRQPDRGTLGASQSDFYAHNGTSLKIASLYHPGY